jgi:glycosyltransferase involved in cell wall biosynthesis
MKIAIIVRGRFHAFGLANALLQRGENVTVLTNYPRWAASKFALPRHAVLSFTLNGVIDRVLRTLDLADRFEASLHESFSRWAARQCRARDFDVMHVFSGVAEEIFSSCRSSGAILTLIRGSSHIRTQARLLENEELRVGRALDRPSEWMIAREEREYAMADIIFTLSSFCRDSFVAHGVPPDRLRLLLSGVNIQDFRPSAQIAEERQRRIESGQPLRVLTVGTFSYRKGIYDLAAIVRQLPKAKFEFRFVGAVAPEGEKLAGELKNRIDLVPKQPQNKLPLQYAWADIFLFPTIEDGFPTVLAQAAAAGLPILTTPNGAGADLVDEGHTGWVLPIRAAEVFVERLLECERDRPGTARMAASIYSRYRPRDFSDMADEFIEIVQEAAADKTNSKSFEARSCLQNSPTDPAFTPRTGFESAPQEIRRLRIAFVVHGRFHAFDLARELISSGEDVYVLTNYPKSGAARFGIPEERVISNLLHGIVARVAGILEGFIGRNMFEPITHRWFSKWAAKILAREPFDVIHSFSGISEELFRATKQQPILRTLLRGSSHIEEQSSILRCEEERTGHKTYVASDWMRQRELREYELADLILVLSQFAFDSFVRNGVEPNKLRLLSLGTQRSLFRPDPARIAERIRRLKAYSPLRVLTVGTFSSRKGAFDLLETARRTQHFATFRFVGTVLPRARAFAEQASKLIEFIHKVPQFDLPQHYNWGDVFLFPTLEDGYAVVLAQATAAGLPLLATTNCAAPELVNEGETGWVFPIRRPDLLIKQLQWCNEHREELAAMVEKTYNLYAPRDWSDVARDFVNICEEARRDTNRELINVAGA